MMRIKWLTKRQKLGFFMWILPLLLVQAACSGTGKPSICGNATVEADEACDDGNTTTETDCAYGTVTCSACDATCTSVLNLTGRFCGDGIDDPEEACDDGNTMTETECAYGTETCSACDATCTSVLNLTGRFCGDGVVDLDAGETCDGDCPMSCDDGLVCTSDTLTGHADNCSSACSFQEITECRNGDDCCPSGCDATVDFDCSPWVEVDSSTVLKPNTRNILGQGLFAGMIAYAWDEEAKTIHPEADELFYDLGMGLLGHFPGGAGIITHDYHWKNVIGPVADRTDPTPRESYFDFKSIEFGPDEYGALLEEYRRLTGREVGGSIQINIINGTAEEAADWVEYMNAPNDGSNPGGGTDWAALRADHGHPEPYNIQYWELGNEPHYTANDIGSLSCQEYVDQINLFVPLMKERDPNIKVMAYVNPFKIGDPEAIGTATEDEECSNGLTWSQSVIQDAGANLDHLYLHWYGAWNDFVHDYDFIMGSSEFGLTVWLDRLATDVDNYAPDEEARIRLSNWFIPEWNVYGSWIGWVLEQGKWVNVIESGTALLGAVANSRVLHVMATRPEIQGSMHNSLVAPYPFPAFKPRIADTRSGYALIRTAEDELSFMTTAAYQVAKLWSEAFEPKVVSVRLDNAPMLSNGETALDVSGLLSEDGERLSLVMTNAALTVQNLRVDLGNFIPSSSAVLLSVSGGAPTDNNTWTNPENVVLRTTSLEVSSQFTIPLLPHSVAALKLTRQE